MVSTFCSTPPPLGEGDGKAIFDSGKRVTNVRSLEGQMVVEFDDIVHGKELMSMQADLVIAADGSSSRVREIVQPGLQRENLGYVAWRGTVPTRDLPQELVDTTGLKTTFYMMPRNYLIT